MTIASAPASSANLGPGYDVVALALELRSTVSAEPAAEWSVLSGDEPASEATVAMIRRLAGDAGPHSVTIASGIPTGCGLGSSAALLVAAAAAIREDTERDRLLTAATEVEGHPDNVAAAVFGGCVAVGVDGAVHRLGVHPSLQVVVAVPDEVLPTAQARSSLSAQVPREVAVRTVARSLMLVEGLRTGDAGSLRAAMGDEIHEAPRRAITATPARLIESALEGGALYAAWSGAGPSVIAFTTEDGVDSVTEALEETVGGGGRILELDIDRQGVMFE